MPKEQRLWEEIVARMDQEQRLPLATLAEGTRVRLEDDALVILFDFEFSMQEFQAQLLDPKEQAWLQAAVEEKYGRRLDIRPRLEEASGEVSEPSEARPREPSEHEILTRVRTIFPEAEVFGNNAAPSKPPAAKKGRGRAKGTGGRAR